MSSQRMDVVPRMLMEEEKEEEEDYNDGNDNDQLSHHDSHSDNETWIEVNDDESVADLLLSSLPSPSLSPNPVLLSSLSGRTTFQHQRQNAKKNATNDNNYKSSSSSTILLSSNRLEQQQQQQQRLPLTFNDVSNDHNNDENIVMPNTSFPVNSNRNGIITHNNDQRMTMNLKSSSSIMKDDDKYNESYHHQVLNVGNENDDNNNDGDDDDGSTMDHAADTTDDDDDVSISISTDDSIEEEDYPQMGCICGKSHANNRRVQTFWLLCEECKTWYEVAQKCVGFTQDEAADRTWTCNIC